VICSFPYIYIILYLQIVEGSEGGMWCRRNFIRGRRIYKL